MTKDLLFCTVILTECLSVAVSNLRGQTSTNAQFVRLWVTTTNWQPATTNRFLGFRSAPQHQSFRQAIMALRHAKLELQHSKDTFNGHQQTAIDACDKAIQELEIVARPTGINPSFSPQSTPQHPPTQAHPENSMSPVASQPRAGRGRIKTGHSRMSFIHIRGFF